MIDERAHGIKEEAGSAFDSSIRTPAVVFADSATATATSGVPVRSSCFVYFIVPLV
ncbi:uncharacterized protein GLRG_03924 [Colletotrichum graminicola M1.001]|uniref:Uncharacterized protein n=1 Tax=Colletotrichum graminicola (strain M1.001 / M2 / FGSC 10212) TaxID=645133 RepID=E3QD08_COLGM|nr:uncharacterized protein GLRG_03924 [Colletotrichum graminicola M1.001]EFQ28780.1 hypothetical protein GLRG_03924 [Colletotrichum graminicola M1.001]